jgi:chitin synthase
LGLILGLPGLLVVITAHSWSYIVWMLIYLLALPIWNFVLPTYAFWKFDDFSWGETRKTAGEKTKKAGLEYEGGYWGSREPPPPPGGGGGSWTSPPGHQYNDEYFSDA